MSHQNDTISEHHYANGLNIDILLPPPIRSMITISTVDNADRYDSNHCDKPDYLNIDCDNNNNKKTQNLNIRWCVGMDFEVNKCALVLAAWVCMCVCVYFHYSFVAIVVITVIAVASGDIFSTLFFYFEDLVRLFLFGLKTLSQVTKTAQDDESQETHNIFGALNITTCWFALHLNRKPGKLKSPFDSIQRVLFTFRLLLRIAWEVMYIVHSSHASECSILGFGCIASKISGNNKVYSTQ